MNNISDFEIALLGFIKDKPMHGYAVHRQIMKLSGAGIVWNIKQSRLYQMLIKLEENYYIQSSDIPQEKRPTKKLFELTEKGLVIFNNWKMKPIKHGRDFRIIFLLKLFFVIQEGDNECRQLLESQKSECKNWANSQKFNKSDFEDRFSIVVENFRYSQIEHYIDWLNWCDEFIRSK